MKRKGRRPKWSGFLRDGVLARHVWNAIVGHLVVFSCTCLAAEKDGLWIPYPCYQHPERQ